jgi:hypothetical protein
LDENPIEVEENGSQIPHSAPFVEVSPIQHRAAAPAAANREQGAEGKKNRGGSYRIHPDRCERERASGI